MSDIINMERPQDLLFLLYFLSHIPLTVFFDSQFVLPRQWYPVQIRNVVDNYVSTYKDPMVGGRPYWYLSFCVCELLLHLPFSFVGAYVYWQGVSKCKWARIPMIIYSSHVITTMVPIYTHMFCEDFTNDANPGPSNLQERLTLAMFYLPYLLVPVFLLIDSLFSTAYRQTKQESSLSQSTEKAKHD